MAGKVKCPFCGSTRTQSAGSVMLVSGLKKRTKCTACGHVFYTSKAHKAVRTARAGRKSRKA